MLPAPTHPTSYFVLLIFCGLLGLGLAVTGWHSPRRRLARALAGAVAAAGLWFSAFPPQRPVPAAQAEAILLTDGYAPDTLRQLRRRLGVGTPVWRYGTVDAPASTRPLSSLLGLAEHRPAVRRLHVLGHGLPASELPMLGKMAVQLHAGALPPKASFFNTAYWQPKLALGQELQVEGRATSAAGGAATWACLQAAGAVRDSVRLPAGGGAFGLRYRPKTAGLAEYSLLLRRADRVLAAEPVPVEITPPQLPAVLLLAATPSFEFKFLKTFLGEAHYPVALRTTVSRGLVQTDFVNQPAAALDRLTPALLARFTILVADAATLAALTPAEASTLQASVAAGRLGLVVAAEAAPLPRAVPGRVFFTVLPRAAAQAVPQPLAWPGAPPDARAALPAQIRPAAELRALVSGAGQAEAAASHRVGLGFVVVTVVPETFHWGLQGRTGVYASYWNRLLTAATPPSPTAATWQAGSRWPRPQQPLTLHLSATFPAEMPTVQAAAAGPITRLAMRQDPRLPEWSSAQFWPVVAGWHRLRGPGSTTQSFYVYPAGAWAAPERLERLLAAAQRGAAPPPPALAVATVLEPWPAAWFFGLFLLAAGFLWLEEKL